MKVITRVLAIMLILSGLMPLMATLFAATDQSMILEMFHFDTALTAELQVTFVMMGSALLFASVIQFLAAAWVWKGKPEGLKLSIWLGGFLIASALYIFATLSKLGMNDPSLYAVDIVKGLIILTLATIALKKTAEAAPSND